MVGGKVIGLARGKESTLVHVKDAKSQNSSGDECSIRVVEKRRADSAPVEIGLGDSIWWQGRDALWTPKENARRPNCDHPEHITCKSRCGVDYDIRLPRLGYSH